MNLSVVIPALNEAQYLAACLHSVKAAGIDEVVVVDGGSEDETVQIATEHGVRCLQGVTGRAAQQNFGATETSGDVLLFLHADCQLPKEAAQQVQSILQDSSVVAGGFRQAIEPSSFLLKRIEAGNAGRIRRLGWVYGDQAIFVRRSVFETVGQFPNLAFMEDLFLAKQLKRQGKIGLADGPLRVSARRWQNRGVVRQTVCNWLFITAAHLGISPNRLAAFYRSVR